MSPRFRRTGRDGRPSAPPHPPPLTAEPVWLPGTIEVHVAGESYRADAVRAVQRAAAQGGSLAAMLIPEPTNSYDPNAVAVFVLGRHVGYLPAHIAARVQPALSRFSAAHQGRLVSCPAIVVEWNVGPQVILLLDPSPLGVAPEAFETVPDLAATVGRLLDRLDRPPPLLRGIDTRARAALAAAEAVRAEVDATPSYERPARAWRRVEQDFRDSARMLEHAGDPMVGEAWLGIARATRYQRDRRDDVVAAFVTALYYDRGNADAWWELVEYGSLAPHVPTLVSLFSRIPLEARPDVVKLLLSISYGEDRHGKLSAPAGQRLRTALVDVAEAQSDSATAATVAADEGLRAEKDGDIDRAVQAWRRAIDAGCTDARVADRFSVWLVGQGDYSAAEHVLRQALVDPPTAKSTRERLQKRLGRCQRARGRVDD